MICPWAVRMAKLGEDEGPDPYGDPHNSGAKKVL